jgi:hypothetical protein
MDPRLLEDPQMCIEVYDRHGIRPINMNKDGFVPEKTGEVHEVGAGNYKEFPSANIFHTMSCVQCFEELHRKYWIQG